MSLAVKSISFKDFRSYGVFDLHEIGPLTILVGPNAVGKTNVVEGIQLLTSLSSFRHPTMEQLVRDGAETARLEAVLEDETRLLDLALNIAEGKREYFLNGKAKRPSDLKGLVPSVVFTPDDLELVKGSSAPRRTALDALGSQLSSNHYVIKKDYEKVIRHKNRLLKEDASFDLVASIDEMILTVGSQLACYRSALFERLAPVVSRYYETITEGREQLEFSYIPSWEHHDPSVRVSYSFTREEARRSIEAALEKKRAEERARKRSLVGPHADHIEFFIDGRNASMFASQGQCRTIVLAVKLAEVSVIQDVLNQKPVLLLDDVMSELDASRREALVSFIEGDIQTFITTANLSYFDESLLSRAKVVQLPQACMQEKTCKNFPKTQILNDGVENPS